MLSSARHHATQRRSTPMPSPLVTQALQWLRSQLSSPQQAGFWVLGGLIAAIVTTNLIWLLARFAPGRRLAAAVERWPFGPPLAWLLGALYLLLPPLGAWRAGVLSPYLMGLSELDWLATLGSGSLLAGGLVV